METIKLNNLEIFMDTLPLLNQYLPSTIKTVNFTKANNEFFYTNLNDPELFNKINNHPYMYINNKGYYDYIVILIDFNSNNQPLNPNILSLKPTFEISSTHYSKFKYLLFKLNTPVYFNDQESLELYSIITENFNLKPNHMRPYCDQLGITNIPKDSRQYLTCIRQSLNIFNDSLTTLFTPITYDLYDLFYYTTPIIYNKTPEIHNFGNLKYLIQRTILSNYEDIVTNINNKHYMTLLEVLQFLEDIKFIEDIKPLLYKSFNNVLLGYTPFGYPLENAPYKLYFQHYDNTIDQDKWNYLVDDLFENSFYSVLDRYIEFLNS